MFLDDSEEINEVYRKVDSIFRLKIKVQLKGTGLTFERFYYVTDMLTDKKFYTLAVNKKVFGFDSTSELYSGLLKIIENEEKEIKRDIEFYEEHRNNDLNADKITIDYNLDVLNNREYKLSKLKNKIRNLLSTNN